MRKLCPVILIVLLSSWLAESQAIILFDNLGNTPADFDGGADVAMGQKFTTDANIYNLDSVTMRVASPNTSGPMTIQLYSHNTIANEPLASVYTIYSGTASGAGLTGSFAPVTFSGLSFTLAPSSAYWIVAKNDPSTETVDWQNTLNASGSGVGFTTRSALSTDGGAAWTVVGDGQPYIMRVIATPIPEPTAVSLVAIGAVIAAAVHRARRSRTN